MKMRFYYILILINISCRNDVLQNQESYEPPDSPGLLYLKKLEISKCQNQIIDWYKEYHSKEIEKNSWVSSNEKKSIVLIGYSKSSETPELTVFVPNLKKDYITGDLNGDNLNDLIVNVNFEFGGSGSSFHSFVFLGDDTGYQLEQVYEQSYFEYCDRISYWQPISIENGIIFGKGTCYSDDDATCCPSIQITTSSKFNAGEIQVIKIE